jgi:hypothetical protein
MNATSKRFQSSIAAAALALALLPFGSYAQRPAHETGSSSQSSQSTATQRAALDNFSRTGQEVPKVYGPDDCFRDCVAGMHGPGTYEFCYKSCY